jgi:hypothetical protein
MSNVYACERLLPVVAQFAAEQIHQQPVREAAVAPMPVLPHHADGTEAHLGIAADRLVAGGRRVNRDPVVTALAEQRSSVVRGCPAVPRFVAAGMRTGARTNGPGRTSPARARLNPERVCVAGQRNRDRPPIGPASARQTLGRAIMAKTTTNKTKAAAARSSAAAKKSTTPKQKGAVARTADLSEEVLKTVEAGQRAAIEAVRSSSTPSTRRSPRSVTAHPAVKPSSVPPWTWPTSSS